MTVTASRLGSSSLTLDWSNLVRVPIPGAARVTGPDTDRLGEAWKKLKNRFAQVEVGFYDSSVNNDLSQLNESLALVKTLRERGLFTDCLFLGIGGSALGPISMLAALQEKTAGGPRFHFMENPDPIDWRATIERLNPASTLVCVVTKSGTTFETMALCLLAIEWLGRERLKTHLVAITDPQKGDLKAFATQEKLATLHIHPSIGGRFSIFSPVGFFPAALAGLNVNEFQLGAKQVRDFVERAPVEKNPLFILANELLRHAKTRPIHVCMPYSTRLKLLGAWFVQLWGESLGKDGKGFTPLAAVGATDQHSILQLLRDGPDDKVTFFVNVGQVADEVKIPRLATNSSGVYPAFKMLEGHSLHELLNIEYRATSVVLARKNRPTVSLQLDQLDERGLGGIYFAFSVLTAMTGALWDVNPFDQPGVEEGKVYIREALSKGDGPRSTDEDNENSPVARLRRDRD